MSLEGDKRTAAWRFHQPGIVIELEDGMHSGAHRNGREKETQTP